MPPRFGAGHEIPRDVSAYAGAAFRPPQMRKLVLPPAMLVYSTTLATMTAAAEKTFFIRTPQVQCRCLIHIGVEFDQGYQFNPLTTRSDSSGFNAGATLWLAHLAELSGRARAPSPIENIRGTADAPVQIPTDRGLWGHKVETQSAGGLIYGDLIVPIQTPDAGCAWWLTVEFQGTDPMSDQEWREQIGGACIQVTSGATKVT